MPTTPCGSIAPLLRPPRLRIVNIMSTEPHSDLLSRYRHEAGAAENRCAWPGCDCAGEHKAPKSPTQLNEFQWFCLEHAREFNKSWNYYDGMSDEEVEADVRRDTVWNRPTWPLGNNPSATESQGFQTYNFADPFGFFEEGLGEGPSGAPSDQSLGAEQRRAAAVLGIDPPITLDNIKGRYKELVKRHHPDAVGNGEGSDERIKEINHAYGVLIAFIEG